MFERLAKNNGIKVEFASQDWRDGPIAWDGDITSDELRPLWIEAGEFLTQLMFQEVVTFWIEDGNRWHHATHDILAACLMSAKEPNGLFVDRDDLEAAAASTYPKDFSGLSSTTVPERNETELATTRNVKRRGRPPKSGAYDDTAPLLEMDELLHSGAARSVKRAAEIAAKRLDCHSYPSTVKRLSRKFIAAREKGV